MGIRRVTLVYRGLPNITTKASNGAADVKKDAVRLMLGRGTRAMEAVAAGIGVNAGVLDGRNLRIEDGLWEAAAAVNPLG